jgi:hypothetical protein
MRVSAAATPTIYTLNNSTMIIAANITASLLCPAPNSSLPYVKVFTLVGQ